MNLFNQEGLPASPFGQTRHNDESSHGETNMHRRRSSVVVDGNAQVAADMGPS